MDFLKRNEKIKKCKIFLMGDYIDNRNKLVKRNVLINRAISWNNDPSCINWLNFPLDCIVTKDAAKIDENSSHENSRLVMFCPLLTVPLSLDVIPAYLGFALQTESSVQVGFKFDSLTHVSDYAGILIASNDNNWIQLGLLPATNSNLMIVKSTVVRNGSVDIAISEVFKLDCTDILFQVEYLTPSILKLYWKNQHSVEWNLIRECESMYEMMVGPFVSSLRTGFFCEFTHYSSLH
jgi:regulation of enolase protein 1 (concanavalin A-like superfamily)